jgi:hypothetical protein
MALDAEGIAKALGGAQPSGNGWKARCPSHDDETPSLSLSDGENGRVLLHCHAGCSQSEVIAALVALGLWPNKTRSKRSMEKTPIIPVPADAPPMSFKHPKYGAPVQAWPYHLADGGLAGYIARFDFVKDGEPRKDILPITYCDLGNGTRGWRSKGIPEPRPLHRLPELLVRADAPVLVTEGEKAANAAQGLFPDYAVTTPMHGAKSPAKTDWTPVKGRSVTIWPDRDQPGTDFGWSPNLPMRQAGQQSALWLCRPSSLKGGAWLTSRQLTGRSSGCAGYSKRHRPGNRKLNLPRARRIRSGA